MMQVWMAESNFFLVNSVSFHTLYVIHALLAIVDKHNLM